MPDISMCCAKNCPVAGRCYRHADSGTVPDDLQSYMGFEPEKGEACRGFWPIGVRGYWRAVWKFNGGNGALLCNRCGVIIATGIDHEDVEYYCVECRGKSDAADHY
jgi:hypothetical protein